MKCIVLIAFSFLLLTPGSRAQEGHDSTYRYSASLINNLVHTKLDVRFDYQKHYLYGHSWTELRPHFYPTDSLTLDAKGMELLQVAIVRNGKNIPLQYQYDGKQLRIHLDKTYTRKENYTVFIDYISKPDELPSTKGSAAITSSKGLYFINADGKNPHKPVQIWTQGETEANSVWFPTIDKPNQKTTSEISMTVPDKYLTLSNGKLNSQKQNNDHTRTDDWVMDLPHAPYLFMMAVGDFRIYKDKYGDKEVSYYLVPEYARYAKQIFGNTPEMIRFFSSILGVDYPWNKYAQIECQDYVSGAMENTTATLHGDYVLRTDRELLDGDAEDFISHELFHQWFGDLVTCESWSNISLNESFANYSEYLWYEHQYGKDKADSWQDRDMNAYFAQASTGADPYLARFYYDDKEDVFDNISYQKGGRILHMLRNYVGDSAFFASLHLYLQRNAFKSAEIPELRLAFEEVTGKDMNWFFDQWYYGNGYPKLEISWVYDEERKQEIVKIKQVQEGNKVFQLPFAIDLYQGGKKWRTQVFMTGKEQSFSLPCEGGKPDLVNVDGDKILLAKKTESKTLDEFIYQYLHAGNYLDRKEAIRACLKKQDSSQAARDLLAKAIHDPFGGLRRMALDGIDLGAENMKANVLPEIAQAAKQDGDPTVRASALAAIAKLKDPSFKPLFINACSSESFSEAGAALSALSVLDFEGAYQKAHSLQAGARGPLALSIGQIYVKKANEADLAFFQDQLLWQKTYDISPSFQFINMLSSINNTEKLKQGLDHFAAFTEENNGSSQVEAYYLQFLDLLIKDKKTILAASKDDSQKSAFDEQVKYAEKIKNDMENGKNAKKAF
jgi:aminopeptidase N